MITTKVKLTNFYSLLLAVSVLMGCKEEERKPRTIPLNSFSMQVDGEDWKPYEKDGNPCYRTLNGQVTNLGAIPFYTINAYRDPNGVAAWWSENLLRIQVMNVTEPGTFLLDGTYKEDFDSYIIFQIRQDSENRNRYVNNPSRSAFVVTVNEFIPISYSSTRGIIGSFSGILYNEENLLDSLIIENGEFTLGFVNGLLDKHCD